MKDMILHVVLEEEDESRVKPRKILFCPFRDTKLTSNKVRGKKRYSKACYDACQSKAKIKSIMKRRTAFKKNNFSKPFPNSSGVSMYKIGRAHV